MRKSIALLVCIFCSSLTFATQYNTTYSRGVTDISSWCTSGTNCWWKMSTTVVAPVDGAVGMDGYMLWRKTDGSLWTFDSTNQSWSQVTMQYPNTKQIAIQNSQTIYRLEASDPSYCGTGPTFRPQKWNGSAWVNLSNTNECKLMLAVGGRDGTLMSIGYGNANGAPVYKWNGSAWATFGSVQLLTISAMDANTMCGMSKVSGAAKIYWLSGRAFSIMPTQPSGTPAGCSIAADRNDRKPALYAWSTAGVVSVYDWVAGTWKAITTPSVGGAYVGYVMTAGKDMTFMTMGGGTGGGYVYHYNVFPAYIGATTAGSFPTCPGVGPCPPDTVHTLKIQVKYPHGISGTLGTAAGSPTANLQASSWDAAPNCDPIFGSPFDPECTPQLPQASNVCSHGGALPQPGPVPSINESVDAKSFNGTIVASWSEPIVGGYAGTATCGASLNACAPFTYATCSQTDALDVTAIAIGPNVTPDVAILAAETACELEGQPPSAWKLEFEYEAGDPTTCVSKRVIPRPLAFGVISCF